MEAEPQKGILMDCEACNELLADFMLDELSEREALLVHEHLLICPACMKAYRELKGTGKSLEAVASMQPITPSETFRNTVRAEARVESEKIVAKLPPERRLRLEARREARQSIRLLTAKKPPAKVWSPGLLILALAGALVLAVILFWPQPQERPIARKSLGVISVTLGKTEQFYLKENQPHTPVAEGKGVLPGDSYTTSEMGRARIDLTEGGAIFLGPSCDATFRITPGDNDDLVIRAENGEFGFLRPDSGPGASGKTSNWELRTDAGILQFDPATHAYLKLATKNKTADLEVTVLAGSVHAQSRDGSKTESLYAGQKATLSSVGGTVTVESLIDDRPPAWRADLLNDADLSGIFGANSRLISRKPGQIQVELSYKFQVRGRDWMPEPEPEDPVLLARSLLSAQNGVLKLPSGIRLRHTAKFAPPFNFEIKLNPESRRETALVIEALQTPNAVVAVDLTKEATLSVQEKGKVPRRDRLPARGQSAAAETLNLEIKPEGAGFAATLNTSTGKSKSVALWKEKPGAPGDLWIQALGEGILADEIKITGILSVDWLREKLSGAQ